MLSKRLFGLLLLAAAVLAVIGLLAYDVYKHHPIGERFQLLALLLAGLSALIGLTLVPLGDNPL